ncbi:uncharacterized protein (DUF427 family) [Mycobacterium sp. MAA66]|jgi:uncharacterized protein (DUF427 family)|uniref:DUF427 domain-containing protein n=1 Tax=Mycobacterium sp. MAA66 TaxID=3156297 RepID=UPI003513B24F
MTERPVLLPSTEHPITITATVGHVTVRVDGRVVAETDAALTLQESNYPAVQYIPLSDVDQAALTESVTTTYCPYKGEANYFDVLGVPDVIWTYRLPYDAVGQIAGHVAFYPDKADIALS